jgi:hypothetical protein
MRATLLPSRIRLLPAAFAFAALLPAARSATLTFDATLHLKADDKAAVVATLPAGTAVAPLVREELQAEGIGELPAGWIAVRFPGPTFGFVLDSEIRKDLTAKPGAIVRVSPSPDTEILTMVGEQDAVDLVEPAGAWAKVVVRRELLLFLNPVPPESRSQAVPEPLLTPEQIDAAAGKTPPKPAPVVVPSPADATPRLFQGYLMRTRRVLWTGPKLDYQLVDENNRRIALLDLSSLLVTEDLGSFEGRLVNVFGTGASLPEVSGVVIKVENLRLAR